jgi:hypothetical protein
MLCSCVPRAEATIAGLTIVAHVDVGVLGVVDRSGNASHVSGGRSGGWMCVCDRQDGVMALVEHAMHSKGTTNQYKVVVAGEESV